MSYFLIIIFSADLYKWCWHINTTVCVRIIIISGMFGQVIRFVLMVRVQFFRRGALQNSLQNIGVIAAPSLQQLHISLLFMLPVVCLFIVNNLRLIPTGTICCYGRLELTIIMWILLWIMYMLIIKFHFFFLIFKVKDATASRRSAIPLHLN